MKSRLLAEAAGCGGLILLAFGFFGISELDAFPGYNALYPCLGACLLIYAGENGSAPDRRTIATRCLEFTPLVWVGLVSYSLYLIHWPVSAFVRYVSLQSLDAATATLMVGASIGLAALSWKYVEQPFRGPAWFTAPRPVFFASGAAIAAVCAFGLFGIWSGGLAWRFPTYQAQPDLAGDWGNGVCFSKPGNIETWNLSTCTRTHGFDTKVLLWGDSIAAQYVPGLAANADRLKADVIQYTYEGCPPILSYFSYARPDCTTFNQRALTVVRDAGVQDVVLSGRWTEYEKRGFEGLQQTIDTLTGMGVRVFVIGQTPQFIADVQKIAFFMERRRPGTVAWPMAMDPNVNQRLRRYTAGATLIDPIEFLCRDGICPYTGSSGLLYFDDRHLSQAGSTLAVATYWPSFE